MANSKLICTEGEDLFMKEFIIIIIMVNTLRRVQRYGYIRISNKNLFTNHKPLHCLNCKMLPMAEFFTLQHSMMLPDTQKDIYTTALNDALRHTGYSHLRLSVVKLFEAPFAGESMNVG